MPRVEVMAVSMRGLDASRDRVVTWWWSRTVDHGTPRSLSF